MAKSGGESVSEKGESERQREMERDRERVIERKRAKKSYSVAPELA